MHMVTIQSDFARDHSPMIAQAASRGLITTKVGTNTFGRVWRVTAKGLEGIQ